jgi:hypothetical protein
MSRWCVFGVWKQSKVMRGEETLPLHTHTPHVVVTYIYDARRAFNIIQAHFDNAADCSLKLLNAHFHDPNTISRDEFVRWEYYYATRRKGESKRYTIYTCTYMYIIIIIIIIYIYIYIYNLYIYCCRCSSQIASRQ